MNVTFNGVVYPVASCQILHESSTRIVVEFYRPTLKRKSQDFEEDSPLLKDSKDEIASDSNSEEDATNHESEPEGLIDIKDPRDHIDCLESERDCDYVMCKYGSDGDMLDPATPADKVRFLASGDNETILSCGHPGFVIVDSGNDETGADAYEIAHPEEFQELVNLDPGKYVPRVRFSYLKTDDQFDADTTSTILDDTYWVNADTVLCPLSFVSAKTGWKFLSTYKSMIRDTESYGLLSYTHANNLKCDQVADVYDLLQFYHVRKEQLWRCPLGQHIWENFVKCFLVFGVRLNKQLVERVLVSTKFVVAQDADITSCDACGKIHISPYRIELTDGSISIGCVCFSRVQYLFNLGSALRACRAIPKFELKTARRFLSQIEDLLDAQRLAESHD
jgi:hypothetical protein